MNGPAIASAAVQLAGGIAVSPLLPGLIQHWKARLQGRPGPSPLQPYRELRRLWRKSTVGVAGTTAVYRLAPSVAAASLLGAIALVPVTAVAPDLSVGHDVLALIGFLALARFALAAAAWDTGSGFSLMGASRDLTVAVFAEVALLLTLAVAAIVAGTTSLTGMISGTAGGHAWSGPALPLGAAAFALVVVAETGRQPFDNPDTHLELTMIHEGPLLEYAGRDLAYLQWASAARHWLLLVLAAGLFLPHPHGTWAQLALLPAEITALCAALAVTETLVVKMRVLLAPRLLGVAAAAALLGIVARQAGIVTGLEAWLVVGLGLGVVVVRRRSVATGLVTAQALVLAGLALDRAGTGRDVIVAAALGARAVALGGLFWLAVARSREQRPVRAHLAAPLRAGIAIVLILALTALVPPFGLTSPAAGHAVLALVAAGLTCVATRRATVFQILGIVLVENGLALAALMSPHPSSLVIELGVTLDLTLIAAVAALFHLRIFSELGAGDSAALRGLRD